MSNIISSFFDEAFMSLAFTCVFSLVIMIIDWVSLDSTKTSIIKTFYVIFFQSMLESVVENLIFNETFQG